MMSNSLPTSEMRIRSSSFGSGTGVSTKSPGSPTFNKQKGVVRRLRSLTENRELITDPQLDNIVLKIPTTPLCIQSKNPKIRRASSDSSADSTRANGLLSDERTVSERGGKSRLTAGDHRLEMHPYLATRPPEAPNRTSGTTSNFNSTVEEDNGDAATQLAYMRCRRSFRARCSLPAIWCGERNRYTWVLVREHHMFN